MNKRRRDAERRRRRLQSAEHSQAGGGDDGGDGGGSAFHGNTGLTDQDFAGTGDGTTARTDTSHEATSGSGTDDGRSTSTDGGSNSTDGRGDSVGHDTQQDAPDSESGTQQPSDDTARNDGGVPPDLAHIQDKGKRDRIIAFRASMQQSLSEMRKTFDTSDLEAARTYQQDTAEQRKTEKPAKDLTDAEKDDREQRRVANLERDIKGQISNVVLSMVERHKREYPAQDDQAALRSLRDLGELDLIESEYRTLLSETWHRRMGAPVNDTSVSSAFVQAHLGHFAAEKGGAHVFLPPANLKSIFDVGLRDGWTIDLNSPQRQQRVPKAESDQDGTDTSNMTQRYAFHQMGRGDGDAGKRGQFVTPAGSGHEILRHAASTDGVAEVEKQCGIPAGLWSKDGTVEHVYSLTVLRPEEFGLRIPTGAEAGAFIDEWLAGGRTLGGDREAIIDPITSSNLVDHIRSGAVELRLVHLRKDGAATERVVSDFGAAQLPVFDEAGSTPLSRRVGETDSDQSGDGHDGVREPAAGLDRGIGGKTSPAEDGQQTPLDPPPMPRGAKPHALFAGDRGVERRSFAADTHIQSLNGDGGLRGLFRRDYRAGATIEVESSPFYYARGDEQTKNNPLLRVAGTSSEYVRAAKLSMHLPESAATRAGDVPFVEATHHQAKGALSDLVAPPPPKLSDAEKKKLNKKEIQSARRSIAEKRDLEGRGFLTSSEEEAIDLLSKSPEGRAFLRENGILDTSEVDRWARDATTTSLWERYQRHVSTNLGVAEIPDVRGDSTISSVQRLQIATRQRELGRHHDDAKQTPGYARDLGNRLTNGSYAEKEAAANEIHARDRQVWIDTLGQNIAEFDKEGTRVTAAQKATAEDNLAILKRVFLTMHTGLQQRNNQADELQDWADDVDLGVALAHGGRVMIELPKLDKDSGDQHAFIDWMLGGRDKRKADTRLASSHSVERSDNGLWEVKADTVGTPNKRSTFRGLEAITGKVKRSLAAAGSSTANNTDSGPRSEQASFHIDHEVTHLQRDLPIGGFGQTDMAGDMVTADGRHGHMYIHYQSPTTDKPGAILVGIETSRMGHTDVAGQHHDKRGAPAEMSAFGVSKVAKIGAEFGGRVVDLSRGFERTFKDLRDAEARVEGAVRDGRMTRSDAAVALAGTKTDVRSIAAGPTPAPLTPPVGTSQPLTPPTRRPPTMQPVAQHASRPTAGDEVPSPRMAGTIDIDLALAQHLGVSLEELSST